MDFIDLKRDYIIKAKKESFTIKQKKINKLVLLLNIINLILIIRFFIITILNIHSKGSSFDIIYFNYALYYSLPILLLAVFTNIYTTKITVKNEKLLIRYDFRYFKINFNDLINVNLKRKRMQNSRRPFNRSEKIYSEDIHIEYKKNKSLKFLDITYEIQSESGFKKEYFDQYDVNKLINNFIRKNDSNKVKSYDDIDFNDYVIVREDDTELQEVYNSKLNQIKYDVPLKYILLISFVSVLFFCLIIFVILKLTIK